MARQYKPFNLNVNNIPLIVYPVKDENPLYDVFKDKAEIVDHLNQLYTKNKSILQKGEYHILFVWNLESERMTDVWIHSMKNWSDSGPLIECLTFRSLEICHDAGIASGDSITALGREEELRRRSNSLKEYVDRSKHIPDFPEGMVPEEEFILD